MIENSHKLNSERNDLSELLNITLPQVSRALVSDYYRKVITDIGKTLPQLGHGIIELREQPYTEQADLMICIHHSELLNLFFRDGRQFDFQLLAEPQYEHLKSFLVSWSNKDSFLFGVLENIYVVYDLPTSNLSIPELWIYLAYHKLNIPSDVLSLIFEKSASFLPGSISSESLKTLNLCLTQIHSPEWVFGFGLLNARGKNEIRIGICGFKTIDQIIKYLERINWIGDSQYIRTTLTFMDDFAFDYVLALDLGASISPRIGIECNVGKSSNHKRSEAMLNKIQSEMKYDQNRKSSIIKWIGSEKISFENGKQLIHNRWLNHIKFIFQPNSAFEIKPYLYYDWKESEV